MTYRDARGMEFRVGDRVARIDGGYPKDGNAVFVERVEPSAIIVRVRRPNPESWFFGCILFAGDWVVEERTN